MSDYSDAVLADNPISYWKLNESSGTTAIDYGSALLNGTYVNAPGLGIVGPIAGDTAVVFAMSSFQNMIRAVNPAYNVGDTVTLEAWVKATSETFRGIVTMGQDSAYMRLSTANGLQFLRSNVAVIATSTTSVGVNVWTHVAATKTGATVKLYINGVDVTGTVTNSTLGNPAFSIDVGSDHNSVTPTEYMQGGIAHAAIYGTALSSTRILAHYQAAIPPTPVTPPIGFAVPCQECRIDTIPVDTDDLGGLNRFLALTFTPSVWIAFNTESGTFEFPGSWGPTGSDNQEGDSFGFSRSLAEQYGVANLGYGSSQNVGRSTLAVNTSMTAPTAFPVVKARLQQFTCVGDGNPDGFGTGLSYASNSFVSPVPVVPSLFLGGDNLSSKCGTLNWPTAAGNVAVTGVGFQPDVVILIWNKHNTLNYVGGINPHAGMSHGFGAASSSAAGQSFATYKRSQGDYFTEGDNNSCFMQDKIAVALNTGASGILASATLVSMDAGGFTLNFSGSADAELQSQSGRLIAYLAMKDTGGGFKVGYGTTKASTGTQTYSGVGFRPNAVLTAHANVPVANTNYDGASRATHGRGMFVSDGSQASMIAGEQLSTVTGHSSNYLAQAALSFVNLQQPVVNEARYSAMTSDGFTLNYTSADGTTRPFGYVAMKTTGTCPCMTLQGGIASMYWRARS